MDDSVIGVIRLFQYSFYKIQIESSWWFQPNLKNMLVKLDHFSRDRGENKKYWKPPASESTMKGRFISISNQEFSSALGYPQNLRTPRLPQEIAGLRLRDY